MAGADEFEGASTVDDAEEHGCVTAHLRVSAEELVDVVEDPDRIGLQVMPERAPCSMVVSRAAPRPLPETSAMRKAVRSSLMERRRSSRRRRYGRIVHAGYGKMRKVVQTMRQQRLLDVAGDVSSCSRRWRSRSRSTRRRYPGCLRLQRRGRRESGDRCRKMRPDAWSRDRPREKLPRLSTMD